MNPAQRQRPRPCASWPGATPRDKAEIEFRDFLARPVAEPPRYAIPPFPFRAPEHPGIPALLDEPTLARPVSQLRTAS
ncbi:hypothetical protein D9599_07740 [Roseomonas sp. KE2513]|uniref:hypothetical protein n=1 Tax=Roseomonas sp. KE2513 TaxID=2479202 RepID=UPI0018DFB83B|nr:hypothetical protein [Roseomonas sp. KE2513]MBI0535459.1 hypothetical protein [Roseomonas sp. KE2513]